MSWEHDLLSAARGKPSLPVGNVAKVVSVDPLAVQLRDVIYGGDRLLVSDHLLEKNHALPPWASNTLHDGIYHVQPTQGPINIPAALTDGDSVFCYQVDDRQRLVVICKVVSV